MIKNKGIHLLLLLGLILPMAFYGFLILPTLAQENDAIAIQIRINPNKYSALRWYKEIEKFEGAPQILQVDGYEAIRDGRTVYVNAGNMSGDTHYSNIYLLSYSQDSAAGTADVFSEMLKHWTFNTNLIDPLVPGNIGNCNISTIECRTDADCKDGLVCNPEQKCNLPAGVAALTCWRDKDCPKDLYCDSAKAEVTRRTKRYANLADIRTRVMDSILEKGFAPKLLSGTYIPGVSLSTWPSWNEAFVDDVDGGEFPVDPLNIMGACTQTGFDPKTCWNENTRSFVVNNTPGVIERPAGSAFYGYYAGNETVPGSVYSFSTDGTFVCPLQFYQDGRYVDCVEQN